MSWRKLIIIAVLTLVLSGAGALAQTIQPGQYCDYLNKDVTALICFEDGQAYIQGTVVDCTEDSVSIEEKCDPEYGIVTVKKCCIVWIREGYDCYEFYR